MTSRKYLQGLAALERNTGVLQSSSSADALTRRDGGADTLTDDGNVRWYGTISVGTPAVEYKSEHSSTSSYNTSLTVIQSILTLGPRICSCLDQTVTRPAMDTRFTTRTRVPQLSTCIKPLLSHTAMVPRFLANSTQIRFPSQVSW